MVDPRNIDVTIELIEDLSIASLKVFPGARDAAVERLQLATPLTATDLDPQSLWTGPDQWLLVSRSMTAGDVVDNCNDALDGLLYNTVDYSAGLSVRRISGTDAVPVLATGSGVDFRSAKFPVGSCCRTRFAHIAAIVVASAADEFDIYVDRSYEEYLDNWLAEAIAVAGHAAAVPA